MRTCGDVSGIRRLLEDERRTGVGCVPRGGDVGTETAPEARSLLTELGELVWTLGLPIVGQMLVRVPRPQAAYWIGSGKAQEICDQQPRPARG